MKCRHVVIIGQPVDPRLIVIGAGKETRISAGFKQQDPPTRLCEPRRQSAASGAGADDNVVETVTTVHGRLPIAVVAGWLSLHPNAARSKLHKGR